MRGIIFRNTFTANSKCLTTWPTHVLFIVLKLVLCQVYSKKYFRQFLSGFSFEKLSTWIWCLSKSLYYLLYYMYANENSFSALEVPRLLRNCPQCTRFFFFFHVSFKYIYNLHRLSCQEKVSRFSMLPISCNGTSLAVSHWKLRMVLIDGYRSSRLNQNKPFSGPVSTLLSSSAEFYSFSLSGRLSAVGLIPLTMCHNFLYTINWQLRV